MRTYEQLFIVNTAAPEADVDALLEQLNGIIKASGGNIDKTDKWGVRKLAYRVNRQSEGFYILLSFTCTAQTVRELALAIPPDVKWILRVDGHTDPQPVRGGNFMSNWELSSARAINVVRLLIQLGVPPQHLAATGFGEFQPIVPGDTEDDYAKDRRIEIRLTDR